MKYFAYGSNMLEQRLKARNRVPNATFLYNASAMGFRLRFHKKSIDRSGKCNMLKTGMNEDVVHGVVFEVPEASLPALDAAEGFGNGYHKEQISVLRHERSITVLAYIADAAAIDDSLRPYIWYFDLVIAGARQHALPNDYTAGLMAVPFSNDPDENRTTKRDAEAALRLYRESLPSPR